MLQIKIEKGNIVGTELIEKYSEFFPKELMEKERGLFYCFKKYKKVLAESYR